MLTIKINIVKCKCYLNYPYPERLRDRPCEVRQPAYREQMCLVLIPADPLDLKDEVKLGNDFDSHLFRL